LGGISIAIGWPAGWPGVAAAGSVGCSVMARLLSRSAAV
jgi:hypothetical protein